MKLTKEEALILLDDLIAAAGRIADRRVKDRDLIIKELPATWGDYRLDAWVQAYNDLTDDLRYRLPTALVNFGAELAEELRREED